MADKLAKPEQLRGMDAAQLTQTLEDTCKEHFDIRFKSVSEQGPNLARLKMLKKHIARIKTVQREKELKQQRG